MVFHCFRFRKKSKDERVEVHFKDGKMVLPDGIDQGIQFILFLLFALLKLYFLTSHSPTGG